MCILVSIDHLRSTPWSGSIHQTSINHHHGLDRRHRLPLFPWSSDGSCSICYQRLGVKIVCSWKHCSCRFHARCAMNHGQDMLIAESDDKNSVRLLVSDTFPPSFIFNVLIRHCAIDTPRRWIPQKVTVERSKRWNSNRTGKWEDRSTPDSFDWIFSQIRTIRFWCGLEFN